MKEQEVEETEGFEQVPRGVAECLAILKSSPDGADQLVDTEIVQLVEEKKISRHQVRTENSSRLLTPSL